MDTQVMEAWQQAGIEAGKGTQAGLAAYARLLSVPELQLPARLRLAALNLGRGALRQATAEALAAAGVPEDDPQLLLAVARQLFHLGEIEAGLDCLGRAPLLECDDPQLQLEAGILLCGLSFYEQAVQRLEHARRLGLASGSLWYQLGLARMYCGHNAAADDAFDACLCIAPDFAPAARMRATLTRQTPASNHLPQLRASLGRLGDSHAFAPLLHYALFKELDDLDQAQAAWPHLERGMQLRRAQLDYDETVDVALFDALARLPITPLPEPSAGDVGGPVPIFIVGMPRSGSTLLERFLCAHPQVSDAGELRDFACQLRWAADLAGGPHPDVGLVQAAASVDLAQVGARYLQHAQWRARGKGFFIDKLPSNFLLAGLIAAALPQARIVDIRRAPMDSCFSNLKALFADAYPHSYDQGEMGRHYLRYCGLMQHWDRVVPGRILQVRYESLVSEPDREVRRVLQFCGLPWSDTVLSPDPAAMIGTASTVQVREPVHRRYLGQWRRYARYLYPLQQQTGSNETE